MSIYFFTVPTATFHIFFVFVVLSHNRRRVVHFNVTEHPTAEWTAQQIIEAFPLDTAPRYLLGNRDAVYGDRFRRWLAELGPTEVLTAPRAPWKNPYAERLISSIRRECLDNVIVLGEAHLRRVLRAYLAYDQRSRTHLSLDKDAPEARDVQPPMMGKVVEMPQVGGLHHRYERRAAERQPSFLIVDPCFSRRLGDSHRPPTPAMRRLRTSTRLGQSIRGDTPRNRREAHSLPAGRVCDRDSRENQKNSPGPSPLPSTRTKDSRSLTKRKNPNSARQDRSGAPPTKTHLVRFHFEP